MSVECKWSSKLLQGWVRWGSASRNSSMKNTRVANICDCLFRALKTVWKPCRFEMQMKAVKAWKKHLLWFIWPSLQVFPLQGNIYIIDSLCKNECQILGIFERQYAKYYVPILKREIMIAEVLNLTFLRHYYKIALESL